MTNLAALPLVTALALAPIAVAAQTPPGPVPREPAALETVAVTGVGKAMLTPDRAVFTVGVQSMAPTVAAAVQDNNTRLAAILAALRQLGATDRELRTSQLSIHPQMEHVNGRRPRISGYQVSNHVTVTRSLPADVGRFLQAAVDAGANSVSGVSFTVSDPARGREGSLQAAFADARAKAETLARAAGRTLGRALSITEGGASMPPPVPMFRRGAAMEMSAQADMPVEPGSEEIAFTLSVIFELR
jgi:uncharacterized protein YggE